MELAIDLGKSLKVVENKPNGCHISSAVTIVDSDIDIAIYLKY